MSLAEILGTVATALAIVGVFGKWLVLTPLKAFIKEQTYPIQPTSNGGRSLADVARTTAETHTLVTSLISQVDRVEGRLDAHIEQHVKGEA